MLFHSPGICTMCKGASMKLMLQKILVCFTNISAKILMQIIGYSFCFEHHIWTHFYLMLLPLKASKFSAQKLLCFGAKNFGEIDPKSVFNKKSLPGVGCEPRIFWLFSRMLLLSYSGSLNNRPRCLRTSVAYQNCFTAILPVQVF